ncbi:centrosomal protein of 131 kDa isoform X2 [Artibeus jamaicensis]|uniref:centrosomal protein of 131 kDa isoform X2 n=1 Tax=Artibeus jamaicensis TaxID=9417 RepID=UPI00235ABF68|nr:centrosomal protein of 131 kDa isoform X2 [Artibeus jamaicensis]XP_053517246.1 centrosomal protein of 131 kDa isoform X2 [Artibeus jamaicensis]XP_053517247.1 centrosomal protein of 131 kDa isoform X2 [Artibeus jamaicensis]XP_053517248.1 centrosomal protein of 131 kDa isoform X2 [Artibeus jamaicensis]XP_053517249.1 centrosomal protein of 131 kDa isoform X2 [Artibeus jamaicensis]XP_053517250.1 centrosomal protein of 131 kDa isoform X2 [Artibeus jamaicensis]
MKGSRALSGTPSPHEGNLEGLDLSLTGLPPPVSRRPSSASAAKPVIRSISVAAGSEQRRRVLEAGGPGAVNSLRRPSSTTLVHRPPARQAWADPFRPAEPPGSPTPVEGGTGGRKRLASLSNSPGKKGATGSVLDEQPTAATLPPEARSPSAPDAPAGPRRRERTAPLAPRFTANNRSNKAAVGNCVTTMVHNRYTPVDAVPPKSSNHTAPSLNNLVKAATDEGGSSGSSKPQKNLTGSKPVAQNNTGAPESLLRRREVTEEEAERFIHQVNQAAITIQRWYRRQAQQRRARAASWGPLLASKQEGRLEEGNLLDRHRQQEAARRKAREEKARQARQAAIQELQQKRAQRSGEAKPGLLKGTWETGQSQTVPERPLLPGDPAHETPRTPKADNTGTSFCTAGAEEPCQPVSNSSPEPWQFPEDKPQDTNSQDRAGKAPEPVGPARSRAKCRSALDELLDTLKLLEAEPEPLPRPRAHHKDRYAWVDEEDSASSLTADNLEKLGRLSAPAGPPTDGALLSEAKLHSILSFLDEMEKSGQDRPAAAPQGLVPEEGLGRLESASAASATVTRLRLQVEEKKQAVALLQRALAQQRDLTIRKVEETERELGRQLQRQRQHYEAAIQRHLCFIDQLIEDKKNLGDKCEAVVAELKQGDQLRKDREAQMREQHELEIKKLRELMSAAEKVRREKWMSEKTRRIKEITVRGLEPEIQKLIAKHKQEVKKLRSLHAAELLQADERAAQHYGRQAEALREQLAQEREALAQQERERAQRRFEQQLEQEQRDLQQLRRRLYSEVAEEKERLGQQAARQRADLEELRQQLEDSSSARGRALRAEFEKGRAELEHRHQAELQALKDQLEVDRQVWQANCARKEEAWLRERERELKEEIRKDRDKDIELVVRRLEADMTLAREESERAAESRVQRVRDKYEAELALLGQAERQLQGQCAELKGRLAEAEGEVARLQGLVRQKDKALAAEKAVNEQLAGERSSLAQVLRQEFADRLAASEEENRQVRAELEQLRREKQAELEDVHGRVKAALAKKEEAVSSLRRQHEAAVKRADHLEELLERRRRPLRNAK